MRRIAAYLAVITRIGHGEGEVGTETRAGKAPAEEGEGRNARVNTCGGAPREPEWRRRRGGAARGKRRWPAPWLLPGSARPGAGAGGDPAGGERRADSVPAGPVAGAPPPPGGRSRPHWHVPRPDHRRYRT